MKRIMKFSGFMSAVILAVIVASGCSPKNENTKQSEETDSVKTVTKVEKVKIITLRSEETGRDVEYSSTLNAFEEVHFAPSTPARIDNIFVEVGSRVKKGDLLVQMDRTQLQQALIQLKNLETDYKRLDTLQKVGSITQQQFDQISTQYEVAKTNADFLRQNTQLRAPFDGVISGKYYEEGEMYSGVPNTTAGKAAILSIVQINPLKAIVSIPETYFPLVSTGMNTIVTCDTYAGKKYTGEIFRKYPTIDPASHSFQVEIKVDNPGEKLRPGMFCRVFLELGKVKAVVVPALTVLKMQGSNDRYVFVEQNSVARRITVTLGQRFDDMVEIISPELKEGDHLVIFGQARLLDGVPVEVIPE